MGLPPAAAWTNASIVVSAPSPDAVSTRPCGSRSPGASGHGFRFSRLPHFARLGKEQEMYELWMTSVLGHAVTRDYRPPQP